MEISIAVLTMLVIGMTALYLHESHTWSVERAKLLDRLMARDWTGYVAGTRAVVAPPVRQLLTDKEEAEWYSQSIGEPVEERKPIHLDLTLPTNDEAGL